jgi:hypothetical protein
MEMESATTTELGLTRLWYLIGDWEGTGKGPNFRFRANIRGEWMLNDHFVLLRLDLHDLDTNQLLIAEHQYIYYDRDLNCLVSEVFGLNGLVEHTIGHADSRGRMALTSDHLRCVPKGLSFERLRRTTWMMAASHWAFTIEQEQGQGQGFVPYLEGQMRRRS